MVKTSMNSTKYIIFGTFKTEGYIDKPDLIGAFFGQTEGLVGEDLEFQNLQKKGKIGRIEILIKKENGMSKGEFKIPTALDKIGVSLVAAAIESIKKIGHTNGEIKITKIKDEREKKRKEIIKRAEELLSNLKEELPDSNHISNEITDNLSKKLITEYENEYFGGPNIKNENEIILVEGRADVLNLLKFGFNNVLCFNGSKKLNPNILKILNNKKIILFLDDDEAGKKELKLLFEKLNIEAFTFAPNGKEVEELTYKEIIKSLKNRKIIENNKSNNNSNNNDNNNIKKNNNSTKIKINKNMNNNNNSNNINNNGNNSNGNDNDNNKINKKNVENSHYFSKKEFNKIEYLIKKTDNKKSFIILNNNFRQIKVGKLNEFQETKTEKGRILIIDGICENSILKKSNEIGINLIICKSKNKSIKNNNSNINIKLFSDFI